MPNLSQYIPSIQFVGATSGSAGTAGIVPAPAAGEQSSILTGDATFSNIGSPQRAFVNSTQETYQLIGYRLGTGGVGPVDGTIYLNHIFCPASTYTKIGLDAGFGGSSGASTTYRIGLYECDQATLAPVNRVYQSAQTNFFSLTTAIVVTSLSISIPKAGWYCVAFIMASKGSWTGRSVSSVGTGGLFITGKATNNTNSPFSGFTLSHTGTSDSLPATITASSLGFDGNGLCGYLIKT